MRELTVRVRFTAASLGNVKDKLGRFRMPRDQRGNLIMLASWHKANLRFAAKVLGRHQGEVEKILYDVTIDGVVQKDCWYRRYYGADNGKKRYVLHESFMPGQIVGVNCCVPHAITDDDLWTLFNLAGRYRGLSPWAPTAYGFFVIESIRQRR